MMIISQGAEFDIATISGTAQSVILQFKDASGANLDIATYSFRGALRGPGAVALCVTAGADNKTAVMAWSKLNAGKYAYDVFLVAQDGTERQILRGVITAAKRVTPSNTDDVITIADIIITIPDNPDGTITITDRTSSAADRAESAAQAAEAAASEVGGHVVDAAMHVSEAERLAWNNKADLAGVESFLEGSDHVFRGKNEFNDRVTASNGATVRCGVVMGYSAGDEVFVDGRCAAALEVYPNSVGSVVRTHIYCPPADMGGGPLNDDDMLLTRAEVVELVEGLLASRGIE